jgi:hypothetical protein
MPEAVPEIVVTGTVPGGQTEPSGVGAFQVVGFENAFTVALNDLANFCESNIGSSWCTPEAWAEVTRVTGRLPPAAAFLAPAGVLATEEVVVAAAPAVAASVPVLPAIGALGIVGAGILALLEADERATQGYISRFTEPGQAEPEEVTVEAEPQRIPPRVPMPYVAPEPLPLEQIVITAEPDLAPYYAPIPQVLPFITPFGDVQTLIGLVEPQVRPAEPSPFPLPFPYIPLPTTTPVAAPPAPEPAPRSPFPVPFTLPDQPVSDPELAPAFLTPFNVPRVGLPLYPDIPAISAPDSMLAPPKRGTKATVETCEPKKERGICRRGYFVETPDRTQFITWERNKCRPSKSRRR